MISFKKALEVHRNSITKNGTTEGLFNVFIFRKISIVISWFLANLKISPNHISVLAFVINIAAGVLLFINFEAYTTIAIYLITLGHILDMSDGEVAKLTNKQSDFGAFLDPFLDRIVDIVLPLTIGYGYFIQNQEISYLYFFLVIIYISLRSIMYYLDLVSIKLNLNSSIDTLSELKSEKSMLKYVKWDGGFSIVLYSISIYFSMVIPLFIFLDLFFILLFVISLKRIFKNFST